MTTKRCGSGTWPRDDARTTAHRADRLARRAAGRAPDGVLRELVDTVTRGSPWTASGWRASTSAISRDDAAQLPVLTETELMEHFDGIVTDSRLSLGRVEQHLITVETGSDQPAAIPRSPLAGSPVSAPSSSTMGRPGGVLAELFRGLLRAKIADPDWPGAEP